MMPSMCNEQAPVPPPSYSRAQVQAQAERARALHINALTLIQTFHLLALACGLSLGSDGQPRIPSPSQLCKRWQAAGASLFESLFVLTVWRAVRCRLIGARDLIIDSAPILAWRRKDPDAALGHAPAHHPRPLLRGYRVHTLLCRGSGLPLHFLATGRVTTPAIRVLLLILIGRVGSKAPRSNMIFLNCSHFTSLSLVAFTYQHLPVVASRLRPL